MAEGKIDTLRDKAKRRILNDMMDNVKRYVPGADYKEYIILVMDTSALKVFSSCCKLYDVYNH